LAITAPAACCATRFGWTSALARAHSARSPASAFDPRPYQLVPLLMALKLDPVRLLIADDVGIGETVEACLIGRELLDRGEVRRLAVLCTRKRSDPANQRNLDQVQAGGYYGLPGIAARRRWRCNAK